MTGKLRRLIAASAVVAAVVAVAGCGGNRRASPVRLPSAVPPFPYAALLRATKQMGDPMPTSAVWVASRHHTAVAATMRDSVVGNEPVYVAVLTGNFVASDVSTPSGSPAPRGTVATFVYDARTGRGVDFGLSRERLDLGKLGRVHDFLPYLQQAAAGAATTSKAVPVDEAAAVETQWLQRLSAGSRLGCRTQFRNTTPRVFERRLAAAASHDGFAVSSIQFLHACQAAPLVVLGSSARKRVVAALPALSKTLDRITVDGRGEWPYEGFFLEVTDSGKPYVLFWNHVRAEVAGGQWAAESDLYPFPHG